MTHAKTPSLFSGSDDDEEAEGSFDNSLPQSNCFWHYVGPDECSPVIEVVHVCTYVC